MEKEAYEYSFYIERNKKCSRRYNSENSLMETVTQRSFPHSSLTERVWSGEMIFWTTKSGTKLSYLKKPPNSSTKRNRSSSSFPHKKQEFLKWRSSTKPTKSQFSIIDYMVEWKINSLYSQFHNLKF